MKVFFILLFSAFATTATAQQWKNYTNFGNINCIVADHDTVWVGTEGGVAKFLIDGTKLATYTHADGLADNFVNGIAIDSLGNKWFSTGSYTVYQRGGLSKFDGANWTTYNTTNSPISNNWVTSIAADAHNNIWVPAENGLLKFNGTSWTNYNTSNSGIGSNSVYYTAIDTSGNLWAFCDTVLAKFDGTNWSNVPVNYTGTVSGIRHSMSIDHENNLWFIVVYDGPGSNPGILKFDGNFWTSFTNNICASSPSAIAFDADNNKWVSSGGGLCEYNDTSWTSYGGSLETTSPLCIDHAGNKWFYSDNYSENIVTDSTGLGRFDGSNWTLYNPSQSGIPNNEIVFTIDRHGNKWAGGVSGVSKFDGINWTTPYVFQEHDLSSDQAYSLKADSTDNIWAGGYQADIYQYNGASWVTYTNAQGPYDDLILNIAVDKQNNKWFSTLFTGVYEFNGTSWTTYDTNNSGICTEYNTPIAVDAENNKWFICGGRISKFDGNYWTYYDSTSCSALNNYVTTIVIGSQDNKWFGTGAGIIKFDGTHWTVYDTTNSGLPNDWLEALAFDKEGNWWISNGVGFGVSKFDGTNWTNYTTLNSGIGDNDVSSIVVDALDNKWFVTSVGLSELTGSDSTFLVWLQFNGNICSSDTITLNPVINNGTSPYTFSWRSTGDTLSCTNCQNPVAAVTQNSIFIVTITDNNNLTAADTLYVYPCLSTGIQNLRNSHSGITVFPNPSPSTFNFSGVTPGATIQVYNVLGEMIYSSVANSDNYRMDLSSEAKGIYFYRLGENGNAVGQGKIVLE